MKKLIAVVVVVYLVTKLLETNPNLFSAQQYVVPSQIAVNQSQAAYQSAQAAQINNDIRRQNEMDNGLGFNMLARIVTGEGITDAEQFASGLFTLFAIFALAPALLVIVVIVLARATRSTKTEA